MIRDDIKIKLINEDLNKLFLPHRDGIDQANYRVGDIHGEIIAWNPDNNLFMDYFYDDYLDIIWFELSLIDKNLNGYFLNREGEVKGPSGKKLKQLYNMYSYPMYNFRNKNFCIHRILSLIFIPNYYIDTKIYVDHVDRNKDNYSINNLRWVTIKENNNNKIQIVKFSNNNLIFLGYEDKLLTKLALKLIGESSVIDKYNNKYAINSIRNSIRENISYHGYYWKIDDLELINYLDSIGLKSLQDIDESEWKEHYLGGFYVHPLGLLKTQRGKITAGFLSGGDDDSLYKERRCRLKNTLLKVHRLVAEVFLNNNKPIESGLVVDHINADPLDNRVENLRICSQLENMNNINTRNKLKESALRNNSRKVISPSGKLYNSIKDCANDNNMSASALWDRLNGRRPSKGFKYYEENDQSNNNNS